jgi:hypothetical protein
MRVEAGHPATSGGATSTEALQARRDIAITSADEPMADPVDQLAKCEPVPLKTDNPVRTLWLGGQALSPSLGWPCSPDLRLRRGRGCFDPP